MKLANKLISMSLSLLILTTCMPVQAQQFVFLEDLLSGKATRQGLVTPLGGYSPVPFQAVRANGGELKSVFADVTTSTERVSAGEWIILDPTDARIGHCEIIPNEWMQKVMEPVPELGEGWFKCKGGSAYGTFAHVDLRLVDQYGNEAIIKKGTFVDVMNMYITKDKRLAWDVTGIEAYGGQSAPFYAPNEMFDQKSFSGGISRWKPEQLSELARTGALGETEVYLPSVRVQARAVKPGEVVEIVVSSEKFQKTAKPGEFVVTFYPSGKQDIYSRSKLAQNYEEIAGGSYKPKEQAQKLIKLDRDIVIAYRDGARQHLRKGDFLNVTDLNKIGGLGAAEVDARYKTVRAMYEANLSGLKKFFAKVETKLAQRFPRYQGVFFKRMMANDTDFMVKRMDQQAAKKAEKIAAKSSIKQAEKTGAKKGGITAAEKATLRMLGGVFFGIAVYIGFSAATDRMQGEAITADGERDIIRETANKVKRLRASLQNGETDGAVVENMMLFMDPYARRAIMRDPALMEQMGVYNALVQSDFGENMADEIAATLADIENEGAMGQSLKTVVSRS